MLKIKIDISKFHVFVHLPSLGYVAVEKKNNSVFEKLRIINDNQFEKISDSYLTEVVFLSYDLKSKCFEITSKESILIKMNELKELSYLNKASLKIQQLLRMQ